MTERSTADRPANASVNRPPGSIKVLVWDLDDTLWDGTLVEHDDVELRPGVLNVLRTLDERGVLHSIASRNDPEEAFDKLSELGVLDYFLYPQIHWGAKSISIREIARSLNLGINALAFIDDQEFERAEVRHVHEGLQTYSASEIDTLLDRPELMPRFITGESKLRRHMYRAESHRKKLEESFEGPQEEFLSSLEMRLSISFAAQEDLQRAEELTVRTNQLNATGYTYSYEELDALRRSDDHILLVASLEDRFGTYGKIGLALIERTGVLPAGVREGLDGSTTNWVLKLLLMSCRVMNRGAGSILLSHVLERSRDAGVRLFAEFRPTDRNRRMLMTYRFAGFREIARSESSIILEHPLNKFPPIPHYVRVEVPEPDRIGSEDDDRGSPAGMCRLRQ